MKVIILAAGRGSRMLDKTEEIPKCMLKLWGKTLIDMCIENVVSAGIEKKDIYIVTGYKSEKIQIKDVNYLHNSHWENSNMFLSLTVAEKLLEKETCLVLYSDIVFDKNVITKLSSCNAEIAITYYSKFLELWEKRFENPLDDLETFKLNENGKVREIGRKPKTIDEVEGQYMGIIKIEPLGWKKIKNAIKKPMSKSIEKLDMTTLLNHLVELKYDIEAIRTDYLWLECDNQNDINIYEKEYKYIR